MSQLRKLQHLLDILGWDSRSLTNSAVAHLAAEGHTLLSEQSIPGVNITTRERTKWIEAEIVVTAGAKVANPVHLCFGILKRYGDQCVRISIRLEKDASASFLAHCLFTSVESGSHHMEGIIEIGEGAVMHYSAAHFHGVYGGIHVLPCVNVNIEAGGKFFSDFALTNGRVGTLSTHYQVAAAAHSVTELNARVFGHVSDQIQIEDNVILSGSNARSVVKTQVALDGQAYAKVLSSTEGRAQGARGHMDCMEILRDEAVAEAVPVVKVSHPLAKITHEAAIGTVDSKQLETLMARGLTPQAAVDVIVMGMLRG